MQYFCVYAEAGQITASPTIESLRFSVQPVEGDIRVGVGRRGCYVADMVPGPYR